VAAVVGVAAGGGVRPGRGDGGGAGRAERAKNLLWAAGKLADYALALGLDLVPGVVLHPSTAERFTRCAPGLSGPARRTLRTNLRFIGRRVVPHLYPADLPLPRERAQAALQRGGGQRLPGAGGAVQGLSDAIMVADEHGPPVPELARRMTASSCRHDPVLALAPVLTAMPEDGIPLGDVLSDSGYSHRVPRHWAAPLRQAGAQLIQDLHPHDRGPRETRVSGDASRRTPR
jgi:hypothetical protein